MSSSQSSFFVQRSAWPRWPQRPWGITRMGVIAIFALLAGCEGQVTMDLATELPADPNIDQVLTTVRGLEFTTSSGSTKTLEFTDSQALDLIDYADDSGVLRLFTDEQLPEGSYTGVRLLFDEDQSDDASVIKADGTEFPLKLVDGDYASLSFKVEDNESSSESFTLLLDLRQSLSFDDDTDEYTLTPVMRSVVTQDMSRIEGNVSVTCPVGDSLSEGAVYLFKGRDITPDDIDGAGVEPFATAPVFTDQGNTFFYALRYLPQGDYTLALTCIGNDDAPLTNEDLEFRNVSNVELDEAETITRDLP